MCRNILITIVVLAFMAATCRGQQAVIPDLDCTQAKVGITYPLNSTSYAVNSPLYYYTCRDATTPMIFPCVEGSGYINNGTLEGCVPWVLWSCTSKAGPPACTAAQQGLRFPHVSPALTWVCQGLNDPQVLACPDGTGYVPSGAFLGCKSWPEWSAYCPW